MFESDLLPRFELKCVEKDNGRWYVTPDGTFPSVTNVLGQKSDKKYLREWRDRIGDKEADGITTQAKDYGTLIHEMCQSYMNGNDKWQQACSLDRSIFKGIKSLLDHSVTKVFGVELPLWSKTMCIAGTSDLIVEWRHVPTIVDYKTSRRPIRDDSKKLVQYRFQATAYAMMIEEIYGLHVPASVIIAILSDEPPQTIFFDNRPLRREVKDIFLS